MPWQSNDDLPDTVRSSLPTAAQTVFREVANSQFDSGSSEARAISTAWSAVREKWKPGNEGKWVEKLGARNSRADLADIQSIHDASVRLGALCDSYHEGDGYGKLAKRSLYVSRPLLNAEPFIAWAKSQGFETTLQPGDLHVTIGYSHEPMVWPDPLEGEITANIKEGRVVAPLGDGGAVVLKFKSPHLNARWDYLRSVGASWDHPEYTPHVTISWQAGDVDLAEVVPYKGDLIFGPERFAEVNEDWKDGVTEKTIVHVAKVDQELGIVFGWAIVSTIKGKPYFDVQGDNIPDDSMLKASANYMQRSRIAGNMHRYQGSTAESVEKIGEVVFAFPLTAEIAKSMKIRSDITGLMIGMKVIRPDVLEKFKDGTYTGFSIGGRRFVDEVIE